MGLAFHDASDNLATPTYSKIGFKPPLPESLADSFPRLEILGLLGHGGMGAVYKARHKDLDRLVALKILPPEFGRDESFMQRFSREARSLARLSHSNIVAIYDFGRVGDLCYFMMEFVDGVNLRQLTKFGTLTPKEALNLIPQICEALQYAHEQGVVHRDIKPENILVDRNGTVKIADFGLAKCLGTNEDGSLTGSQQAMGTYHYMAPEQFASAAEVDHRADIYSLGVVFYELLTGQLPVGRFAPPSKKVQIDVRLDDVVLKTLETEPNLRYQRASDVKTDVESICGSSRQTMPLHMQRLLGFEYRSPATLWGYPIVHIATGINPVTMKRRIAKGWIAIGDIAIGGFALGGMAYGVTAIGGCALGLLTLGGVSLGLLLAIGGMAIGGLALGGAAVGIIAIGGGAVGVYALGGGVFGVFGLGGNIQDPHAVRFFGSWGSGAFGSATLMTLLAPYSILITLVVAFLTFLLSRVFRTEQLASHIQPKSDPRAAISAPRRLIAAMVLGVVALVYAVPLIFYLTRANSPAPGPPVTNSQIIGAQAAPPPLPDFTNRQNELAYHTWWEMTPEGPRLYDNAILALNLSSAQVDQINSAMRVAFHDYLAQERLHLRKETVGNRQISSIEAHPNDVASLEDELWTGLDAVLSVDQQSIARANLRLKPLDYAPGRFLKHLAAPGFFGFAEHGGRVAVWRVGTWFYWEVTSNGVTDKSQSPELPSLYRRFWAEPTTN
jgi:predicted Ser/Thr protein kinase